MEVNFFQILLVDVTFYLQHMVINVLIKKWKPENMRHRRLKGRSSLSEGVSLTTSLEKLAQRWLNAWPTFPAFTE